MTQEHPQLPTPPPAGQHVAETTPVLHQPRWSGKKTAVVAALAIGLSSAGAITASAAVASGTGGGTGRMGGGGFGNARTFEVPGGTGSQQQGSTGQQGNGAPNGAPGAGGGPGSGSGT
ncbi:hypothetical protein [Flexivirga alba]|uniref:Uncharacterized protein n=1 Tax=Flexivirga alba TaxID=702742 RepID=A0ABW2ACH1_9MICO